VSPEREAAVHRMREGLEGQMPTEMTTQAADFLDVSRPFVVKLITRGELPCRMVGTHRRIPSGAVLTYRQKMDGTNWGQVIFSLDSLQKTTDPNCLHLFLK
jgi:excisionase family DNA binding protein